MSDDIVARLRGGVDESIGCDCVKCEAAAEIERLRGDRETMLSLLGTIADIRDAAGVGDRVMLGELAERIKHLRAERDEARRSCCEFAAIVDGADTADGMESGRFYEIAMKYMKDRGWDCFKEDTDGK